MLEQAAAAARSATAQRERLRLYAKNISERLEHVGPLMDVVAAAAAQEPELAQLRQQLQAARLANHRTMIDWLTCNGPLRPGHNRGARRGTFLDARHPPKSTDSFDASATGRTRASRVGSRQCSRGFLLSE